MGKSIAPRLAAAAVLSAVVASAIAGCAKPSASNAEKEQVRIAYTKSYGSSLIHLAIAKGLLDKEGLRPTLLPFALGKPAMAALIDGKADVAAVSDTVFVSQVLKGSRILALATIRSTTRGIGIVARLDRGISSPADLRDKKIAYTAGTSSESLVYVLLLDQDLAETDVHLVDLPTGSLAAALAAGDVDAVAASSPTLDMIARVLGSNGIVFHQESLYQESFCLVASQGFALGHTSAVRALLRALSAAERFLGENEVEAKKIVAAATSSDASVLDDAWRSGDYRLSLSQGLLVDLEDQARWMHKNQRSALAAIPNFLEYVDVEDMAAVDRYAVDIIK
jgi:NitT/TauT family transport system substrate-binding protein